VVLLVVASVAMMGKDDTKATTDRKIASQRKHAIQLKHDRMTTVVIVIGLTKTIAMVLLALQERQVWPWLEPKWKHGVVPEDNRSHHLDQSVTLSTQH